MSAGLLAQAVDDREHREESEAGPRHEGHPPQLGPEVLRLAPVLQFDAFPHRPWDGVMLLRLGDGVRRMLERWPRREPSRDARGAATWRCRHDASVASGDRQRKRIDRGAGY